MFLCLALLAGGLWAADLDRAREYYQRTGYKQALAILRPDASSDPETLLLAGKSAFMLGDLKKSEGYLRAAIRLAPKSEYFHWYGKVLGRRAETASFFTAPKLAVDCRKAFERAVELDPSNVEAWNDLFEYHLEAPGFLGGGLDKAARTAVKIGELDKAEEQYAESRLAEKRKDFSRAEQHLRRAAELAPNQLGRIVDLAKFFARRGRLAERDAMFQKAQGISPNHPKLLFERAQAYAAEKRNLDEARTLLRLYLKADLTPDDPPRDEAERLLRALSGA